MSTEVTTERLHWQHEVVELSGLLLEVDLPGGRDIVPFARSFQNDGATSLLTMLGEAQLQSCVEAQRSPTTRRIPRKAVTAAFRRLVESLGEMSFFIAAMEFEGPLRAALRAEYGVDLRDPGMTLLDLADLAANLPPGCALFRATGGDMAWSSEMHMLARLDFDLRVLAWQKTEDGKKGRNQPKPIESPKPAHEIEAEKAELSRRAQAYLKRTGRA
jgi:hypothetical protein